MNLEKIKQVDFLMGKIFKMIDKNTLPQNEFCTSEKVKKYAFEVVAILRSENIKTTYNNLTNMNFHTLVKILNHNGFFPKNQLSTELSNQLKTLPLKR